jgi:hypothetical protein
VPASATPSEESHKRSIVEDLTTHSGFHPDTQVSGDGSRPTTRDELDKTLHDQKVVGEYEGDKQNELTKSLRDQLGLGKFDEPFDKMGLGSPSPTGESHGIVPHPDGGKADLSEKLYRGGPNRYRYEGDRGYQPPELGSYDDDMNFVPNKSQPFPRMRQKPYASDKPYSPLEDTYDTKGKGDSNPIYNYGQPQSMDFPGYTKSLRDTLPPVPLPRPRPPEAPQPEAAPQSALPETQPQQQVASLGSTLDDLLTSITAAIRNNKAPSSDAAPPPSGGGGLRGEAAPDAAGLGNQAADLSGKFQQLGSSVTELGTSASSASSSLSQIKNDQQQQPANIPSGGNTGSADSASGGGTSGADQAIQSFQEALSSLTSSVQEAGSAIGSDVKTAATGGHIRGLGTSTSDSIPAMLSDGEYVHSARATEHWGVDTMHELNSLRVPAIFQNFNLGGLALRIAHATPPPTMLASGGAARSAPAPAESKMDHWGTIDMRTNHGDFKAATQRDTMRHLSSSAQSAKRFSTGGKPGWYGG